MIPFAGFDPQLAIARAAAPEGDEWLHEVKLDGYRIGCRIEPDRVVLLSRGGRDWTAAFPEVAAAARALPTRGALLDGEVAVVRGDGRTSFEALQQALGGGSRAGLVYFVFDLLAEGGIDLRPRPLEERKAALARLFAAAPRTACIRPLEHLLGNGPAVLREACRLGLEGIVSKRRDQPYRGGRTNAWVKAKCFARQELVIGGFTDPEGQRAGLGALLVGVHDAAGRLRFAGRVGTGFTQASAIALRQRLDALEEARPPFSDPPRGWLGRHAHWVRPELVAEVAFTEWTSAGLLRHPSFQGLREDRRPDEVVREAPAAATGVEGARAPGARPRRGPR